MNEQLRNLTKFSATSDNLPHDDDSFTNETEESPWRTDQHLNVLYIIYAVGYTLIIVFGTIGNILVFIVMGKGSMRDVSTCFYMRMLALADTGKLNLEVLIFFLGQCLPKA